MTARPATATREADHSSREPLSTTLLPGCSMGMGDGGYQNLRLQNRTTVDYILENDSNNRTESSAHGMSSQDETLQSCGWEHVCFQTERSPQWQTCQKMSLLS
ncbi:hypothetical protein NPIL_610751 [Nephila pilipes]|uniref:Uncharacterized protein n=1 Tax=Nephila pilipes TaxID=299642 RepID=A0A8X6T1S4_NEPPI|nr:hypothetical protein NPIL_610751 [Nephila pilipes]